MKNCKDSSSYLLRWFFFFGIAAILAFSFFVGTLGISHGISEELPFFSFVSSITTDGEFIYTMDETFHSVCKYQKDGTLVWCEQFSSWGANLLLINENGDLCRYDVRARTLFQYDVNGKIVDTQPSFITDLSQTRIQVDGTSYTLRNHLLTSDTILVNDGESSHEIRVENTAGKFVFALLFIVFAGSMTYAVYNLFRFIILVIDKPNTWENTH